MITEKQEPMTKRIIKEKYDLPLETQKFLLQMCWAQHDGQWFLKTIGKYGYEAANELNNRVIGSMGKIEARHILNALRIKKGSVTTIPEIFKIMNTFMDVIIPKIMKFEFEELSDTEGLGIVNKCFIWEEVKKAGRASDHECACNSRHYGWLEALGVEGKIERIKRFPDGDDICIFKFKLNK